MPREEYTITVEILNCTTEGTAIATASAYLSFGDQTDTVGYAPNFKTATVNILPSGPTTVEFVVDVKIASDEDRLRFEDQLNTLAKVIDYESQALSRTQP